MSCGTRAQDSARAILTVPGSSVLPSATSHLLLDFPVRTPAADAFTEVLLTDFAAARQFIPARPFCLSSYERNYTHVTHQCLPRPPQIFRCPRHRQFALTLTGSILPLKNRPFLLSAAPGIVAFMRSCVQASGSRLQAPGGRSVPS
jgi:hypothetical protein